MNKTIFGYVDGTPVHMVKIKKGNICASVIEYGATLQSFIVPDKEKKPLDIVLGYDTLEEYLDHAKFSGAIVGRVANRTANASFTMNGRVYNISQNNGKHSLHGGFKGFSKKVWKIVDGGEDFVSLSYFSADMEEGYPANLEVFVTYSVGEDHLKISYKAIADGDTPLSLTNHAYFNLNGQDGQSVFETELSINADNIVPVNSERVADGRLMDVSNTVFDFRAPCPIGNILTSDDEYIKTFKGYDVCYALNGKGYREVATAKSSKSGIGLKTYTDMEGLHLYVSNIFKGIVGKGCVYGDGASFCLETERYPNAVNCKNFPSPFIKKGQEFTSQTVYKIFY